MKRFILLAAVFLIFIAAPVKGDLEYYGIDVTINEEFVTDEIVLKFKKPINHLEYQVNFDIFNLNTRTDFESADCEIKNGNVISCDFVGMTEEKNKVVLTFDTKDVIKKSDGKFHFSANYGFLPTDRTFVIIRLPQSAVLSEDVANNSFFPKDGGILSDGKRIMVFWEREGVGEENLQFSVSYVYPSDIPSYLIISLTIIVIVVMVGVVVYARRKQHPVEVISSVLNKDEKVIVDIITRNEGKALQKTLVKESEFSKAKVSRLVKDMRDRGIIRIEAVSGRENRILLDVGKKPEPEKTETKEPTVN